MSGGQRMDVPNTINAHPHSTEIVSVVHNGIIETQMI
jgi:glucosamine 6-phosphate synthetase-like amidotransferase/phosphosugar isomerase protein